MNTTINIIAWLMFNFSERRIRIGQRSSKDQRRPVLLELETLDPENVQQSQVSGQSGNGYRLRVLQAPMTKSRQILSNFCEWVYQREPSYRVD
jgi:hypothetical protein